MHWCSFLVVGWLAAGATFPLGPADRGGADGVLTVEAKGRLKEFRLAVPKGNPRGAPAGPRKETTVHAVLEAGGFELVLDCSENLPARLELERYLGLVFASGGDFNPLAHYTVIVKGRLRPVEVEDGQPLRPHRLVLAVDSLRVVDDRLNFRRAILREE